MRVAIVHSAYSRVQPSGENVLVERHSRLLAGRGFFVRNIMVETDREKKSRLYPLRAAIWVATGSGREFGGALRDFCPDVVHVHNTFPNIGTKWIRSIKVPVVSTLHNFRTLCPGAFLYRNGAICTDCISRPFSSVVHRCYRGSRAATIPLWLQNRNGLDGNELLSQSRVIIVLSERARHIMLSAGLDEKKVVTLPNPSPVATPNIACNSPSGWIYVGRLSAEKGILQLVKEWPPGERLDIVGEGPLAAEIESHAGSSIALLGRKSNESVREMLPSYEGLIFPSVWPENSPLVYPEALACSLPVVALQGNSVADAVVLDGTGEVLSALDMGEISRTIEVVRRNSGRFKKAAIMAHRSKYSEDAWLSSLSSIYSSLAR